MKHFLFSCVISTACAHAQTTATWNGGTGLWDDGTAWTTNPDFPNNDTPAGTTYNAVITAGEVTRETPTAIQRLTMTGGKLVSPGSAPLAVAEGFDWSGGELYADFVPGNIAAGTGSTSLWSGSLAMRNAVVENAGALTLANGIAVRVNAPEYEVSAGLRNLPGGTVTLSDSGSWLGQWFGEGPPPDGLNNQGTLVKNGNGTFTVGLDPEGFSATPFRNSGTVTVNGGTLQIDAPVPSSTGTWIANSGTTIVFNGGTTLEPGCVVQGAGNVEFAYGAGVSLAAAFPLTGTVTLRRTADFNSASPTSLGHLVIDSLGSLIGGSAVSVTGSLSWLGTVSGFGGGPPVTLAAGASGTGAGNGTFRLQTRTFSNAGSFTWPGGTTVDSAKFDIFGGGQFRNEAGGTFTAAGNGTGSVTFQGTTTGTFTNEGTFDKSGTGTLTRLNWEVANTGLVRALGGRLEILKLTTAGGSFESRQGAELHLAKKPVSSFIANDHAGSYAVKTGGLIEFGTGKLVAAASFPDGTGTVSLAGAEVARDTIPASLVRFRATNSTVDPPSNVLTLPHAAITHNGVIGFLSPKRMRVTGTLDWQDGGTGLPASSLGGTGGTLELTSGSTTTLSGLGTVTSSTVQNAGTFTASSGSTLRVNAAGIVNNTGTMGFGDGSLLELRPSTTTGSDATLTGGTISTSGTGVVRVFTGRNVSASPSYATISGATVNGTLELVANLSRLRLINGGDVKGTLLYTGTASTGQTNFISVDIQQNANLSGVRLEDTSIAQAAKSILAVTGSRNVTFGPTAECVNLRSILGDYFTSTGLIIDTGNSTIINEGTIRVEGSNRFTQLAALDVFENRGTLRAENGATIFADRGFTQTAGRIQLIGGNFTMTAPTYRASTRVVTVSGGSVEGQGAITGHLTMNGGTIAPGNTTGTLTLTGNLTLGGGTLALNFASASNADQLAVNGGVTLTGPVQLVLAPAFNGATTTFTVLANDGTDAITTSPTALFAVGTELLEQGENFTAAGRTWQISYAGGDGNDVTLTLQAGGLTALQSWRQLHFGTTENTGNAANTFDFDQDSIPNLVEFAFGLDPTSATSASLPQPVRSGSELVLSFTPPPGVSGITYHGESNTTLQSGSWAPVTNTGTSPVHEYRLPISGQRGFIRIGISEP